MAFLLCSRLISANAVVHLPNVKMKNEKQYAFSSENHNYSFKKYLLSNCKKLALARGGNR